MQILVDGYNLLNAVLLDIYKGERDDLLRLLENYRKFSKNRVTVVFDSYKAGLSGDTSEKFCGVTVIFTGLGKTADQKIKELVKDLREGCIVVSSDNEIIHYAKGKNAGYIRSEDFARRLFNVVYKNQENDYDYIENRNTKKGNPKRPKKAERKRLLKLKKL